MSCFHPMTLWIRKTRPIYFPKLNQQEQARYNKARFQPRPGYIPIEVPCGKCLGCRLDKADQWATRMCLEAKQWHSNYFLTLTYRDDQLPIQGGKMSLNKRDVQNFWKRLRYEFKGEIPWENPKNGKIENPIRYFVCGEYGPKGGRPHYHAAVFNLKLTDLKPYKQNREGDWLYNSPTLERIWGHGYVVIGLLQPKSANYIARYVQKKAGIAGKTRFWIYDNKKCERHIMVRKNQPQEEYVNMSTGVGLGRTWWEENKQKVKKLGSILLKIGDKVKAKAIPRYFKKLWEAEDWEDYEFNKYENIIKALENRKKILDKELTIGNEDFRWKKHLEKQERLLTEKAKFLKRSNFI